MIRRIGATLALLIAAVFGGVAVAAPAHAGFACNYLATCGTLVNRGDSRVGVGITYDWGNNQPGISRILYPNQDSRWYFKDIDGFYVGGGCHVNLYVNNRGQQVFYTQRGPGWWKISDTQFFYMYAWCG